MDYQQSGYNMTKAPNILYIIYIKQNISIEPI